jgi:signal transduction histidine kinase/CheY-like chemotaxis protein
MLSMQGLWNALTRAPPSVEDPIRRQQIGLLSGLLAILIPCGFLAIGLQLLLVPGFEATFRQVALALLVLCAVYGLVRAGWFRSAAFCAVAVTAAACYAVVLSNPGDALAYAFLFVSVFLAGLLFGQPGVWTAAAAHLLFITAFLPLYRTAPPNTAQLEGSLFIFIASVLLSITLRHIHTVETERSKRLAESEQALRERETELRRLNEQLELKVGERTAELSAARDLAESANRAKSQFLSRMSHELRTPLNAILGFAQVLRMKSPSGDVGHVAHIERAGWHLLALIDDVLDLSRIESGQLAISVAPVDAALIVVEVVRLTGELFARLGVVAHNHTDGRKDLMVFADPTRLQQALINLLSNGAKYNRPGGSVMVDAAVAGDDVVLSVSDTGVGMSDEQLAHLYEPFNRLGAQKTGIEGTGIGLVITRQLVELMGGRIAVRSRHGIGTTFDLHLRHSQAVTPPASAQPRVERGAQASQHHILLYVEDDPANRLLMEQVVALQPGWRLRTAADAREALAAASNEAASAAVLDITLPGVDGYALCRQLRGLPNWAAVPIVALSANAMPEDLRRGRSNGFDDYFTKPLDVGGFLAWLDRTASISA